MDRTLCVTEAGESAVWRNVKSETVASNAVEFFNDFSRQCVETLGADIVIAAARKDEVLVGHEAYSVDNWVDDIARLGNIPDHLLHGLIQVAEVPDLDALSKGATASDNIVVVSGDVNTVTRNRCFPSD